MIFWSIGRNIAMSIGGLTDIGSPRLDTVALNCVIAAEIQGPRGNSPKPGRRPLLMLGESSNRLAVTPSALGLRRSLHDTKLWMLLICTCRGIAGQNKRSYSQLNIHIFVIECPVPRGGRHHVATSAIFRRQFRKLRARALH